MANKVLKGCAYSVTAITSTVVTDPYGLKLSLAPKEQALFISSTGEINVEGDATVVLVKNNYSSAPGGVSSDVVRLKVFDTPVNSGAGNLWANYIVLNPKYFEPGILRQISIKARSAGSRTDSIWLGIFEQPDNGSNDPSTWSNIGTSFKDTVQKNGEYSVWTFNDVNVHDKPIAICASATETSKWSTDRQIGIWASPRSADDSISYIRGGSSLNYIPQMEIRIGESVATELAEHKADKVSHISGEEHIAFNKVIGDLASHESNKIVHVTSTEHNAYNKVITDLATHDADAVKHLTQAEHTTLTSNTAKLNANNTFTGTATFSKTLTATGTITANGGITTTASLASDTSVMPRIDIDLYNFAIQHQQYSVAYSYAFKTQATGATLSGTTLNSQKGYSDTTWKSFKITYPDGHYVGHADVFAWPISVPTIKYEAQTGADPIIGCVRFATDFTINSPSVWRDAAPNNEPLFNWRSTYAFNHCAAFDLSFTLNSTGKLCVYSLWLPVISATSTTPLTALRHVVGTFPSAATSPGLDGNQTAVNCIMFVKKSATRGALYAYVVYNNTWYKLADNIFVRNSVYYASTGGNRVKCVVDRAYAVLPSKIDVLVTSYKANADNVLKCSTITPTEDKTYTIEELNEMFPAQ